MAGRDTKKSGRPSIYSQKIADEICFQIAMGKSLRTLCESEEFPAARTVFYWLRIHEPFMQQYRHARKEAKWALFDMMSSIAEDGTNDWMEDQYMKGKTPGWKVNGEAVQRSKLRVDLIKWQLSKLEPKEYGDKLDIDTHEEITHKYEDMTDEQLELVIKARQSRVS